jgi:hypothetical protein
MRGMNSARLTAILLLPFFILYYLALTLCVKAASLIVQILVARPWPWRDQVSAPVAKPEICCYITVNSCRKSILEMA